jgi:hypothetical protein
LKGIDIIMAEKGKPGYVSDDHLELITDKLIKDSDDGLGKGDISNESVNSGPVTSYDGLFKPLASLRGLFEVPAIPPFSFEAHQTNNAELDISEEIVDEDGGLERDDGVTVEETVDEDVGVTIEEIVEEDGGVAIEDFVEEDGGVTTEEIVEENGGVTSEEFVERGGGVTTEEIVEEDGGVVTEESVENDGGITEMKNFENVEEEIVFEKEEVRQSEPTRDAEVGSPKQVQFKNLPTSPPELTVDSVVLQARDDVAELDADEEVTASDEEYENWEVEDYDDDETDSTDEAPPIPSEVHKVEGDQDASDYDEAYEFDETESSGSSEINSDDNEEKEVEEEKEDNAGDGIDDLRFDTDPGTGRDHEVDEELLLKNILMASLPGDKETSSSSMDFPEKPRAQRGLAGDDIDDMLSGIDSGTARDHEADEDLPLEKILVASPRGDKNTSYSSVDFPEKPQAQRSLDSEFHSPDIKVDPDNVAVQEQSRHTRGSFSDDEAAVNQNAAKEESKRFLLFVVGLAACILVGVAIVLIVISQQGNNAMPKVSIPITLSPSFLRTSAPTESLAPGETRAPQPTPTFPPIDPPSAPQATPAFPPIDQPIAPQAPPTFPLIAPTPRPSPAPTPKPDPPENDVCSDAIAVLSDGGSTSGSISFAETDNVDRCGDVTTNGPGVWYYVLGTGGEMMAHTCLNTAFDSKITIFKGPCSKPLCLESNEDFCRTQSAVSWESVYGQAYRILVHGDPGSVGNGSFELTIISRYNDECSTSIGPLAVFTLAVGPPIIGDNLGANANEEISCDGQLNSSPSVFYHVRGTGGNITASICEGTDFNARISILLGACDNLECIAQSDEDGCGLTWDSLAFQDYYVMIHGETIDDVGTFGLRLTTTEAPANDECPKALGPLQSDGTIIQGSTAGAVVDSTVPFCLNAVTSPGVWYFVTGDGSTLQASLCDGASFDTRLSVYEGDCPDGQLESLICVDGNDDFCGQESLVTWLSEEGTTYSILVHGYQNGSGDFKLSVTSI